MVIVRFCVGDVCGFEYDDDFGYWFELLEVVNGLLFFDVVVGVS